MCIRDSSTTAYGNFTVPFSYPDVLTNDRLFAIQADVIRKEAAEKNCVIIGRCADDILSDHPCHISLFIHAPFEVRQKRIMELYHLNMKQAKDLIAKTDKTRESYYHFYTNHKWDDLLNYDLSVDSSILGYEDVYKRQVFIVWVGAGTQAIIVMALAISLIVTVLEMLNGFVSTDEEMITMARTFGADRRQVFTKVVMPSNLHTLFNSMKVNIGLSLVGVSAGDFLVSKAGLGYLIAGSYTHLDVYKRQVLHCF